MAFFITEATNNKKKDLIGKKRHKARNDELVDQEDYMPKRFGLKYDPPTIVLEYMVMSLGKLYHHKMKLLKLKADSDVNEMIDYLYSRHSFYLKESVVSRHQISNLIVRLQKRLKSENDVKKTNDKKENQVPKAKPIIEQKVETKPVASKVTAATKKKANDGWDDDGWGDDWGSDNEEKDYDNFDLNKLTVKELQKEKQKMDVDFEKNRKKPGDKGFEYDVRKEFGPPKGD